MMQVRDAMVSEPRTVGPEMRVGALGKLLLEEGLEGVCVVHDGDLVGVATAMDLIVQETQVHLPSFFLFLDAFIPLESPARVEKELRKIVGATVREVMTRTVISTTPDEALAKAARLMVDKHLTLLPVVEDGKLVGVLDKRAMLRVATGDPRADQ